MNKWAIHHNIQEQYLDICKRAIIDDNVFNCFKSYKSYKAILEHDNYDIGLDHYNNIIKNNPNFLLKKYYYNKFIINDMIGAPQLEEYKCGKISTTTLRYIDVLSNLKLYFKNLSNRNILEIGSGYGGQYKIISDVYDVKNYYFIDLREPLELTKKYLKSLNILTNNLHFIQSSDISEFNFENIDLIISNYAFSELTPILKEFYLKNIFNKIPNGYLTMNTNRINIAKYIKNYNETSDVEHEARENYIIYWSNNNE